MTRAYRKSRCSFSRRTLTADGNVDSKCKDLGLTHGVKKPCEPEVLVRAAHDACRDAAIEE